eukprot:746504-Hanusia_phi.AAC.17
MERQIAVYPHLHDVITVDVAEHKEMRWRLSDNASESSCCRRHYDRIHHLQLIVAGTVGGIVKIWDAESLRQITTYTVVIVVLLRERLCLTVRVQLPMKEDTQLDRQNYAKGIETGLCQRRGLLSSRECKRQYLLSTSMTSPNEGARGSPQSSDSRSACVAVSGTNLCSFLHRHCEQRQGRRPDSGGISICGVDSMIQRDPVNAPTGGRRSREHLRLECGAADSNSFGAADENVVEHLMGLSQFKASGESLTAVCMRDDLVSHSSCPLALPLLLVPFIRSSSSRRQRRL